MISWVTSRFSKRAREQYKHDQITQAYHDLAADIGGGISEMGLGDPWLRVKGKMMSIRDPELYHLLDELEVAYAELGYRIITIDDWVDFGGWGVSIDHLWLMKRDEGERPVYTKLEPKRELPERSHLLDMVWNGDGPVEAYRDDDGKMHYREIKD
jgi:hypothetical protein